MIRGILPALLTPMDDDGASVNHESLRRLVEFHIQSGASGFFVCGGTGEGLLLNPQEVEPNHGLAAALSTVMIVIAGAASWWYATIHTRAQRYAVVTGKAYRPPLSTGDYLLLDMALRNHPQPTDYASIAAVSLDHSLWLHRPVRFDQWHLYTQDAVAITGHRALIRGTIRDAAGHTVASTSQEVLIRPIPGRMPD